MKAPTKLIAIIYSTRVRNAERITMEFATLNDLLDYEEKHDMMCESIERVAA